MLPGKKVEYGGGSKKSGHCFILSAAIMNYGPADDHYGTSSCQVAPMLKSTKELLKAKWPGTNSAGEREPFSSCTGSLNCA